MVQDAATDAEVDNLEADYVVTQGVLEHCRCEEMMPTETTVGVELVLAELGPQAERPAEMQDDRHID